MDVRKKYLVNTLFSLLICSVLTLNGFQSVKASPHMDGDVTPPSNPVSFLASPSIDESTWQKAVNQLTISWEAGSDETAVAGYRLYWGQNPGGTSSDVLDALSTTVDFTDSGIYYFRLNTQDTSGNLAGWVNVFSYHFDNSPPNVNQVIVAESNAIPDNTWQNVATTPDFTFSNLTDPDSGILYYYLYWGINEAGTSDTPLNPASNTFSPGEVADGIYYLRIREEDNLNNISDWRTIYTFKLDRSLPLPVVGLATETHAVVNDTWQNTIDQPSFTWDAPESELDYQIYWGTSPTGTDITSVVSTEAYTPAPVISTGVWYLRIKTVDAAGNLGDSWTTVFTYKYDATPPDGVGLAVDNGDIPSGICQLQRDVNLTWLPPSDDSFIVANYLYYWGIDKNGESTASLLTPAFNPPPIAKGEKYYLRLAAVDEAGNIGPWTTSYLLCNGDQVSLIPATSDGTLNLGLPASIDVSLTFPAGAYSEDYYGRIWNPTSHSPASFVKEVPFNHQSFFIAFDKAATVADIPALSLEYTFSIHYEDINILALQENSLAIYQMDDGEWKKIQNSTVDPDANLITAHSNEPGEFLVMGNPIALGERLSIQIAPINFGEIILTGRSFVRSSLQAIWHILDATYTDSGWHVTIRATNFSDALGNVLPVSKLTVQIPQDNVDTIVGSNHPITLIPEHTALTTDDQVILSAPMNASTGLFDISPIFRLNIPADIYKGTYTNQVVVTIISGPD